MDEEKGWTVVGATSKSIKENENELKNEFFLFTKMFTVYNAMLFIKYIYNLTGWKGMLFHKQMPVKGFVVIGIVTEVHRKDRALFLRVDDGTGSIKCVFFLENVKRQHQLIGDRKWTDAFKAKKNLMAALENANKNLLVNEELELGCFIQVIGNLRMYQGRLEIIGEKIRKLDPDYEAYYLNLKLELHTNFYDLDISWTDQFVEYKKGNPGIYAVKFLRERNLPTFTLAELKKHDSIILKESGLDMAIGDMKKAGFMYKDQSGSYQIVEFDHDLQEFVLNCVEESVAEEGISIKKIYRNARRKYPNVDSQNIKLCLKCLELKSLVHSTIDEEHFRAVR